MRAIIADEYDFHIPQSAVTFTLNAIGDPDNIDANVLSGTQITAYRDGIDKLTFTATGEYRKWNLAGYPTHFTDADGCIRYCYIALERNGVNALIVYPSTLLDIFGRAVIPSAHGTYPFIDENGAILGLDDAALPDQLNQRLNGTHFFIFIGTLTSSRNVEQKVDRAWSAPNQPIFGLLDTAAYWQQQSSEATIYELLPLPNVVTFERKDDGFMYDKAAVTVRVRRTAGNISFVNGEEVPHGYRVAGSTKELPLVMPDESITSYEVHPTDAYLYLALFKESDGSLVDSKSVAIIRDGYQGKDGKDGLTPVPHFSADGKLSFIIGNQETEGVNIVPEVKKEGTTTTISLGDKEVTILDGSKGDKGDKGDQGEQGIQGVPGADGEPGTDGKDGLTPVPHFSADGKLSFIIGNQETEGVSIVPEVKKEGTTTTISVGDKEVTILDGVKGDKGDQGEQGIQGDPGADGKPGTDGKDGTNGENAISVNWSKSVIPVRMIGSGWIVDDEPEDVIQANDPQRVVLKVGLLEGDSKVKAIKGISAANAPVNVSGFSASKIITDTLRSRWQISFDVAGITDTDAVDVPITIAYDGGSIESIITLSPVFDGSDGKNGEDGCVWVPSIKDGKLEMKKYYGDGITPVQNIQPIVVDLSNKDVVNPPVS